MNRLKIQRRLKLAHFSQKDKFLMLEQGLCRRRIAQPGIDKFRKWIFCQQLAANELITFQSGNRFRCTDRYETTPDRLVAEFLTIDPGDIPDCESLRPKQLPDRARCGDVRFIKPQWPVGFI